MFEPRVMPTLHTALCAESPGLAAYDGKTDATRLYGSSSSDIILLNFKPISHQTTNSSDLRLDFLLKPQVQHIVQEYIGKYGAEHTSSNIAKHPIMIEAVTPRAQLRTSYGQGFASSGNVASTNGPSLCHGGSYDYGL